MAIDFFYMNVRNMMPEGSAGVNIIIPPEDLSTLVVPPKYDEAGRRNIVLMQPTDNERHIALGRFMDSWSKLEMAISQSLARVLDLELNDMPALANSLGVRGMLSTLRDLARRKLSPEKTAEFESLLDSVKDNATRRNNLAHGFWMLEWFIRERAGVPHVQCIQYRAYEPADAGLREKIKDPQNKKERLRYLFSIKRIISVARAIDDLTRRIQAFNQEHLSRKFPNKIVDLAITSEFVGPTLTKPSPNN